MTSQLKVQIYSETEIIAPAHLVIMWEKPCIIIFTQQNESSNGQNRSKLLEDHLNAWETQVFPVYI